MKACRVCGVEGRTLCFSCLGKLSSMSPKAKAHLAALNSLPDAEERFSRARELAHKGWANSDANLKNLIEARKSARGRWTGSPKQKIALTRMQKTWNDSPEGRAHVIGLQKRWSNSPEGKTQLAQARR